MADRIPPATLLDLLEGDTPRACIDVREPGEYNSSHIPGVSLLPRRQLEFQLPQAVPFAGTQVVICDDDGRRAALAAQTVEAMGYRRVAVLQGGINRWVSENHPTEWGTNVPSKDFGEKVEVVHHVPEIDAHRPAGSPGARRQAAHYRYAHARRVPALLHPRRAQRARGRAGPAHHRHRAGVGTGTPRWS